jgi:hypothetical protein
MVSVPSMLEGRAEPGVGVRRVEAAQTLFVSRVSGSFELGHDGCICLEGRLLLRLIGLGAVAARKNLPGFMGDAPSFKPARSENSLGPEGAKRFLARTPNAAGKKTTSCRVGQEAAPDTDFVQARG